jgi:putative membrane protein
MIRADFYRGNCNMLWVKAFHIIFMVCWFSGIFYLPRLFVNHASVTDPATRERLGLMEAKLYRFITPFMILTLAFGAWLSSYSWSFYISQPWFHAKLSLVAALVVYHIYCGRCIRRLHNNLDTRSHVFYRIFNELPVFALFAIIILVVVKPS